jgi:excisionase family DNA binding protein
LSAKKSLADDAEQIIGFVAEGACPLCRVELRIHDGRACCPCCGDTYKVADHRLEVRQCPEHGRHCVGVLTLGEACVRLGVTRVRLEAMIAAGKIEALPTGLTRTIPTREVERLSQSS